MILNPKPPNTMDRISISFFFLMVAFLILSLKNYADIAQLYEVQSEDVGHLERAIEDLEDLVDKQRKNIRNAVEDTESLRIELNK